MSDIDRDFAGNLDAEAAMVNLAMKKKGFHEDKEALVDAVSYTDCKHPVEKLRRSLEVMFCLSQHALIGTEVAELSESVRKPGPSEHLSNTPLKCDNCGGTGRRLPGMPVPAAGASTACSVCRGNGIVPPPWAALADPIGGPRLPPITGEEEECADILIRLLHYCGRRNLRLGLAYQAKTLFNDRRPHKHGKLA